MPIVERHRIFKAGGSYVVAVPTSWVRWIQKIQGPNEPIDVEVTGERTLYIRPILAKSQDQENQDDKKIEEV